MTTFDEYQNDKKLFCSKITGEADVKEDFAYPYGFGANEYCKSQSWTEEVA